MSTANETLSNLLVSNIAEQVSAKVLTALAEQQQPVRVTPRLMTVCEAASYLARSEQSVQHLIFSKDLPVVRVGRRVHLDKGDLDDWVEKHKY